LKADILLLEQEANNKRMKSRDIPRHSSTTIAGLTQGSLLPHLTPT